MHREYVEQLIANPHIFPWMLSWGGELMGYAKVVYVKEDLVAGTWVPGPPSCWWSLRFVEVGPNNKVT